MKTTIRFYLNDKEETEILSIYSDQNSENISFNVGDEFWYSIDSYFPKGKAELKKYFSDEHVAEFLKSHNEKIERFSNQKFKIIKKLNSINNNPNLDDNILLNIDYYCKEIEEFKWKWMRFKRNLKSFFEKKK